MSRSILMCETEVKCLFYWIILDTKDFIYNAWYTVNA